ncbi:hypothetical protein ACJX0J_015364, partial [Zea mays]
KIQPHPHFSIVRTTKQATATVHILQILDGCSFLKISYQTQENCTTSQQFFRAVEMHKYSIDAEIRSDLCEGVRGSAVSDSLAYSATQTTTIGIDFELTQRKGKIKSGSFLALPNAGVRVEENS